MEKEIKYYLTINGKCPYAEWYNALNKSIQLRIDKRIENVKDGIYGDHKRLQNSKLSELRLDFGKGYRIYYYDLEETIVLFIAGSDKSDQKKTIQTANKYFDDFNKRKETINDINR